MIRLVSRISLVLAAAIAAATTIFLATSDASGTAASVRPIESGTMSAQVRSAATPPMDQAAACTNKNALGISRVLEVGTTGGLDVGFKTYPASLPLEDKEVVLTFDDGPLPPATNRVLDALEAQCVKATFFLIGRNAQAHPNLVRREIADGDTIGSHTWSHPAKTLRGISEAAAKAEIVEGFSAVQRASGEEAYESGTPHVPFFRFPGFADTPALLSMLHERNIAVFGADIWASDWNVMTPEAELQLLMQRLDRVGRGIILLHDIKAQTAAMLPAFLAELKAKGYHVVHIVPGSGERSPVRPAPPSWTSETEATLAHMMPRTKAAAGKVKPAL